MNRLVRSIQKRFLFPTVLLVGLIFWMGMCHSHYQSYWNGTIYRVQTVDFNLLHHTLPMTLSHLILAGQDEEVQRVLNCTFGIFGIVITDPDGREILFKTSDKYKKETWQPKLNAEYLQQQNEPFDWLTNPPPTAVQYAHRNPRDEKAQLINNPKGQAIGRVYYIRGVAPAFLDDLAGAVFSNWTELNGSKRGYILLTLIVVGFSSSLIALVLWRQRVLELREKDLSNREGELTLRRRALDHLNADIASQRKRKEWLENEAELAYQRALRIKETLLRIKEDFFLIDPETAARAQQNDNISVRPPLHKASALIGEVESLLPELTHNARILRSQAEVWQSYCSQLESRQAELQRLLSQRQSIGATSRAAGIAESYAPPENQAPVMQEMQESPAKFS